MEGTTRSTQVSIRIVEKESTNKSSLRSGYELLLKHCPHAGVILPGQWHFYEAIRGSALTVEAA